jgi:L-cysteine desulfidase
MSSTKIDPAFVQILREELVPATGCTEPIAIALAAAKARDVLGELPDRLKVFCSRNIFKNTRCVTVPNSAGLKGVRAAAVLGVVGGEPELNMDVLSRVSEGDLQKTVELLSAGFCTLEMLDSGFDLHIIAKAHRGDDWTSVEIKHTHNNISEIIKNGEVLLAQQETPGQSLDAYTDRSILNFRDICAFAETCRLRDVRELIDRQIAFNRAIAIEGMTGTYGVGIGPVLLERCGTDSLQKARAYAAAGAEARMAGCPLPVITNSGSGNQGITCSVPLMIMAQELSLSEGGLIRALVLSNLLAIYFKVGIGRISAFCGAVTAACGAGAGMTFLAGGSRAQIRLTLLNTLACTTGMICDGAKPSCASKISVSLDGAILGHQLAMAGSAYGANSGILQPDVDALITSIGEIAVSGMRQTDRVIMDLMLDGSGW